MCGDTHTHDICQQAKQSQKEASISRNDNKLSYYKFDKTNMLCINGKRDERASFLFNSD